MANIQKYGQSDKTVLLLPGLLNSSEMVMPLVEFLQEDATCYVVSYEEPFDGTKEVQSILSYFNEQEISTIDLLYGISMGANLSLLLLEKNPELFHKCFLDGGIFLSFPKLVRIPVYKQVMDFVKEVKKHSKEEGVEMMKHHSALEKVFGILKPSQDKVLSDIVHTFQTATEATIKAQLDICFGFTYPKLDNDTQQRCVFFYGEQDPSRSCKEDISKYYPNATILDGNACGYCELLCHSPEQYAELLQTFL